MIASRFRPDHCVTIRRYHEGTNTFAAAVDISADTLAIQTSKAYGQAAGGFSLTTTLRLSDFWESVNPNDMVKVELDPGDGTGLRPAMVGLISRIAEGLSMDSAGVPRQSMRISGFDLGKILLQHNAAWDIARYDSVFGDEFTNRVNQGLQVSGTPPQLIRGVVDAYLYLQVPWTKSWILLDRVDDTDDWMTLDYTLAQYEGPVWQVLDRLANKPWNVLHTETGEDGKLHLILERAPFSDKTGRLTREEFHAVSQDHAAGYDLGRDDTERINWLFFDPQLLIDSAIGRSIGPVKVVERGMLSYDESAVHRHGLRGRHVTTMYTPFGTRPYERGGPDDVQKASLRGAAMWQWYRHNHTYRNGQLIVKGDPKYRAGEGVLFGGYEYLVEQVAHNYVWGQTFQTHLNLTRGQKHE